MSSQSLRPRILYVEDHEDTLEMVSLVLSKNEFDVTTANTLKTGTELARQQNFDLYLIDLWLPDGVGVDLARSIRELDRNTPIVFFSAAAYEQDRADALEAGAQAYVTKPMVPSELCHVLTTLIELGSCAVTPVPEQVH
jgi:DNA-binding response OmpR family regulator